MSKQVKREPGVSVKSKRNLQAKEPPLPAHAREAAVWHPLSALRRRKGNPRRSQPVEQVASAIKRLGWGAPIIARADGEIIAGDTRAQAAEQLAQQAVLYGYGANNNLAKAHALKQHDVAPAHQAGEGGLKPTRALHKAPETVA